MIRKPIEKARAIELRKEGKSVKEIGKLLSVSSSTVSLWVRHILLTPQQKNKLVQKVFDALQKGRIKAEKVQRRARKEKIKYLFKQAKKQFGKYSKRDHFIAGVALYWAEGFKKDNRLGFATSDPKMARVFIDWLINAGVNIGDIRLRVGLNISHKTRWKEVDKYWSMFLNIPLEQFQKPFFQKFKWKKEFIKPNEYFGVLRIRAIGQGGLFVKILRWIELMRDSEE